VKVVLKLMIAVAVSAAAILFDVPAGRASFGDAPWCVVKTGDDVYWDCEYRTSQECVQALAAGNRGFCNVNPSPGPSRPAASAQPEHRKRRAQ
jgi:Protein of unknown function (DUF3551)